MSYKDYTIERLPEDMITKPLSKLRAFCLLDPPQHEWIDAWEDYFKVDEDGAYVGNRNPLKDGPPKKLPYQICKVCFKRSNDKT